jgi:proteasome lid subunit RPN8/RPN11
MENVARSSATFAIDPEEQFRIITEAESQGLVQVGIYHSHPAPPKPSKWDLKYMEFNPVVWIIDGVSIIARRMKAYQLIDGELHSVRIETV